MGSARVQTQLIPVAAVMSRQDNALQDNHRRSQISTLWTRVPPGFFATETDDGQNRIGGTACLPLSTATSTFKFKTRIDCSRILICNASSRGGTLCYRTLPPR